jgi:hypothetical protein
MIAFPENLVTIFATEEFVLRFFYFFGKTVYNLFFGNISEK